VQEVDPGSGADHPGHFWLKLSTAEVKRRKDDDSGWDLISSPTAASTIDTGAFGSLPAAGNAGAVYLPNDAPALHFDDGAAWQLFGPLVPLKLTSPPTTWLNQGGATIDAKTWGHYLYGPPSGSTGTIAIRGREMAYPTPPFIVDVLVTVVGLLRDFQGYLPIFVRDSSSGHIVSFGNARGHLEVNQWSSTSAFNTSLIAIETSFPSFPLWYRMQDDNTDRIYSLSSDGQHWLEYARQARTTYVATPDKLGFGVNNQTATYGLGMTVHHWLVH
jgi:hypothetical protein